MELDAPSHLLGMPRLETDQGVKRDYCARSGGDLMDFDEPSGAACMFGGVSPCGLDSGAPPLPVLSGPVEPCGWLAPLLVGGFVGSLPEFCACALSVASKPSATAEMIDALATFPKIIMSSPIR
jgi:hypothetical protein